MSWMQRGTDEKLVQALQERREVQRGPLPRHGSPYADESPTTATRIWFNAFGVTTLFLVILVVLMAASMFYYAQYSGALRWLLLALVLGVVGFVAVRIAGAFARDPTRLSGGSDAAKGIGGDLRALRTTLERAHGGLAYSQLVFDDSLRKAFLDKVRVNRNLSPDDMDAALKDPRQLQAVVGDRELTVFVLESARNSRMYPATIPALPKRQDFARRIAYLLDRMEAWR